MLTLLAPVVAAYPGWTLFGLFWLAVAIVEAVPATARAFRPKCESKPKEKRDV